MKLSLNWLREYCDLKLSTDELRRLFPQLGMEVDGVSQTGSDTVFELAITANRADLISVIGVARELGAQLMEGSDEVGSAPIPDEENVVESRLHGGEVGGQRPPGVGGIAEDDHGDPRVGRIGLPHDFADGCHLRGGGIAGP